MSALKNNWRAVPKDKGEGKLPEVLQSRIRDENTRYEKFAFLSVFFCVTTETSGMVLANMPYAYVKSGGMIISSLMQMVSELI